MKKYITLAVCLIIVLTVGILKVGSTIPRTAPDTMTEDRAMVISHIVDGDTLEVWRDNTTGIMYLVDGNRGLMCPMVDEDGEPMSYEEWKGGAV